MEVYHILLAILIILTALLAVEFKRTIKAVASFLIMSVMVAVAFFSIEATYAAAFQLLIYAGAVVVMILITLHAVKRW
ncbi:MAG: hypothetical protein QXQ28_04135 [Candidatus Nezhaarchaeales archaeon]